MPSPLIITAGFPDLVLGSGEEGGKRWELWKPWPAAQVSRSRCKDGS